MNWRPYVPLGHRRAMALVEMNRRRRRGENVWPVEIKGRLIARSFWGKGWCAHLESFSDFANRLPRGRTYVRNGSVCHLRIQPGNVEAIVSGSDLYHVSIGIEALRAATWASIKARCSGQIGSALELLQGKLSERVMSVVIDRCRGLFPKPGEIALHCTCPDWARMCKHVAAVLYGVGNRLDDRPELLFVLRGVDVDELIATEITLPEKRAADDTLADDALSGIFGIDLDTDLDVEDVPPAAETPAALKGRAADSRITGQWVARLRERKNLTVAQFAKALRVTPATVYRWEATPGPLKVQKRSLERLRALHER